MVGVLDGVKVLDVGHFVAVPAAGVLLGDWGADITKIEPLSGDAQRGNAASNLKRTDRNVNWRFEVHNRNKRSMAVNLKHDAGRDILYELAKSADIFMTNYETATLARLKIDYESLKAVNPRLIYASLSGYGTSGPEKDGRGFDFTAAWARSGVQHLLCEPGASPPMAPNGMMDRATGTMMVAGVLAALLHREKTGQGQQLELSLYHSGVWGLAADLQETLGGNTVAPRDRRQAVNPLCNTYRTRDGFWVQLAMLQADSFWTDFCEVIARPDLKTDPRFDTMGPRADNREELITILDDVFASATRSEWETSLHAGNCIFGWVEPPEALINDPQAKANGLFTKMVHPEAGESDYITSPVKFRQNPATIRTTAPAIGQHTEEILLEMGRSWDEITALKDIGAII
jgi:crotonobetainyl-CoA:carnitine CoA-transferase CaiB-like acyl-CoA transferase